MKRVFFLFAASCLTKEYHRDGFSGLAPEPTLALSTVACGSAALGPDASTHEMIKLVQGEWAARIGREPTPFPAGESVCAELGKDADSRPRTKQLVRELARATGAASVAFPALDEPRSCAPEQLAVRDANGRQIGSVESGRTTCSYSQAVLGAYLFNAQGDLLWSKSGNVNMMSDAEEHAQQAAKTIFAEAPSSFKQRPPSDDAAWGGAPPNAQDTPQFQERSNVPTPYPNYPMGAYPAATATTATAATSPPPRPVYTLPADAPKECRAALAGCAALKPPLDEQCAMAIVNMSAQHMNGIGCTNYITIMRTVKY